MITIEEHNQDAEIKKVNAKKGCSDCENAIICKYMLEFNDFIKSVESMDLPEVVSMEVSCEYYKGKPHVKRMDMQGREYNPTNPSIMIRKGRKGDHIREKAEGKES